MDGLQHRRAFWEVLGIILLEKYGGFSTLNCGGRKIVLHGPLNISFVMDMQSLHDVHPGCRWPQAMDCRDASVYIF
jgi:hypothetical protein